MPEEVYDIIHKLTYQVNDEKLHAVSQELASQINRLDVLGKRAKALSDAYDKTASNEIAKREKIRKLIIQTQAAIEKEGDAIEGTLLHNKELNAALQRQYGLVGALDKQLELLRQRRDRAFDPDRVKQYNRAIAEAEQRRSVLTQVAPESPYGISTGNLIGGVAVGNIVANLFQRGAAALKNFAVDVVSTTQKYEKLSALLANTLGGKSEGTKAFKLLTDFAAETPFQLDELTASYLKLVNRGIKPTKEELTAFGDIAASQGKSFDQFTEAVLDATTGEFERLKEFGIKAKQTGDQVTLFFGNISKTVPKSADAIKRALLEIRNEAPGIAGAMKVISNTIEGQLSNLGDGFDRLKSSIGARFQQGIKDSISAVSEFVGYLNDLVEVPVEDKLEAERIEINALIGVLADSNTENAVRVKVMQELNAKYPELLKNIDLEKADSNELLSLLNGINLAYEARIKKAGAARLAEKASQSADSELSSFVKASEVLSKRIVEAGLPAGTSITSESDIERLRKAGEITNQQARELSFSLGVVNSARDEYNQRVKQAVDLTKELNNVSSEEDRKLNDRVEYLKNFISEYTAINDKLKKEGGFLNLAKVTFNETAIKNAQAELAGLLNGTPVITPSQTTPPKTSPTATDPAKAAKDREKAYQDAIKKENDRYEKERAQLEEKYNRQRLDARIKFAGDEEALAAELLKIKENQEAEAFKITTERETSHQNNLLAIQKKYRGIRSTEYAKASADIVKAEEDEAARRLAIQQRTNQQLAEARRKANAQEVARIADARKEIDKVTANQIAEIEKQRNLALLGANTLTGGQSVNQTNETQGVSNILEARLKIPKDKTGKLAEDSYKQITDEINRYYDRKKVEIEIKQIELKLEDPKVELNYGSEDIAALKKKLLELQVLLSSLSQPDAPATKELKSALAKTADDYSNLAQAGVSAYQQIAEAAQQSTEAQISAQERRVEQARRIADRGNAELLQMEEKRLDELNKKKAAAAQTELAINSALALSNSIVAVAKAAAAGSGYGTVALVALTLGALAAGYAFVRTLSTDVPAYKDGVIDLQGPGTSKSDSIPARLSKGESVMTAEATKKYKDVLIEMNYLRYKPELPNYDNSLPQKAAESQARMMGAANYKQDFRNLQKELKKVAKATSDLGARLKINTIDTDKMAEKFGKSVERADKNRNL